MAIPTDAASDGLPPHREVPDEISALSLAAAAEAPGAVRVRAWADRVYMTTGNAEESVLIYDVSDPLAPKRLGHVAGIASPREGLDVLYYGDRTVLTVSNAGGAIFIVDVTNPAEPSTLAELPVTSHTVAVHRPAKVIYNAEFTGTPPGSVQIFDASDPLDIKLAQDWAFPANAEDGSAVIPMGCHEITVEVDIERAFCATEKQTQVWDVSDPLEPLLIHAIPNPIIGRHTTAFTILNGNILAIGDESGRCAAAGPVSSPYGGVWFYDLGASPPRPLGWVNVPPPAGDPSASCTAHFGTEVVEGSGWLVFGWFGAGTVLIDARDPEAPVLAGTFAGGSTSDAYYYRGYVMAADATNGMAVLAPE